MLLSVKNLSVGIGTLTLLESVSFDLAKGEIMGLVGESGSGKSLTALALTGLLPAPTLPRCQSASCARCAGGGLRSSRKTR